MIISLDNWKVPSAESFLIRIVQKTGDNREYLIFHEHREIECFWGRLIITDRARETWIRVSLGRDTLDILNDVVETKDAPPAMSPHIIEYEACARVRRVASNHTWRQKSIVLLDISECDVVHVNQRLSFAGHYWVKKATWVIWRSWLVLLLRADINRPPDRTEYF